MSGENAESSHKNNFKIDIVSLETKKPKEPRLSKIDYRNSALKTKLPLRIQMTITQKMKPRMEALRIKAVTPRIMTTTQRKLLCLESKCSCSRRPMALSYEAKRAIL